MEAHLESRNSIMHKKLLNQKCPADCRVAGGSIPGLCPLQKVGTFSWILLKALLSIKGATFICVLHTRREGERHGQQDCIYIMYTLTLYTTWLYAILAKVEDACLSQTVQVWLTLLIYVKMFLRHPQGCCSLQRAIKTHNAHVLLQNVPKCLYILNLTYSKNISVNQHYQTVLAIY